MKLARFHGDVFRRQTRSPYRSRGDETQILPARFAFSLKARSLVTATPPGGGWLSTLGSRPHLRNLSMTCRGGRGILWIVESEARLDWIYVFQALGDSEVYKVGVTSQDVDLRHREVEAEYGIRFRLVATFLVNDADVVEREIHRRLLETRVEWSVRRELFRVRSVRDLHRVILESLVVSSNLKRTVERNWFSEPMPLPISESTQNNKSDSSLKTGDPARKPTDEWNFVPQKPSQPDARRIETQVRAGRRRISYERNRSNGVGESNCPPETE